jgi:hypothetical protein
MLPDTVSSRIKLGSQGSVYMGIIDPLDASYEE